MRAARAGFFVAGVASFKGETPPPRRASRKTWSPWKIGDFHILTDTLESVWAAKSIGDGSLLISNTGKV